MLIMLDIQPGEPILVRWLLLSHWVIIDHIFGRVRDA
jgi:hypothetical protein